ncbi:MAG: MFS transporter [Acidimicrobiia bacterium]|nr:MFS transporter [Acidimicrobiia bacterium]
MSDFLRLLRRNRNYRYLWLGQIVSEIGDHFNTIAVFTLALENTGSGVIVSGVLLARAVAVIAAGPVAGVLLDRMDRRKMMLMSDVVRALVGISFLLCLQFRDNWMLFLLSGLLMFASPFFTSGRAAILPIIANRRQLHTANSLTQTTQWTTLAIGTMLGGTSVMQFGYALAFILNGLSFLVSAVCIGQMRSPSGFRPRRDLLAEQQVVQPWKEYREGLRYMRGVPLIFGLALLHVGWATGGGAAQVLFSLFGVQVFNRGAAGIGIIWAAAAVGLLFGGAIAHKLGKRLDFNSYKWTVAICYVIHGATYVLFSQMKQFWLALLFIGLSRAAVGVTSVLNMTQLLRHVADEYRGRVFSTIESMNWATMMFSMMAAGIASDYYSPRLIGACSGILSGSTAIFWAWGHLAGKLTDPAVQPKQSNA